MKRTVLTLFLSFSCLLTSAQEWNLGGGLSFALERFRVTGCEIHDEGVLHTLPVLNVEAGYNIPGGDIGVFLGAYCNYAQKNLKGAPEMLKEKELIVNIVPMVRYYFRTEREGSVRYFTTLGAGARLRNYSETLEGDTISRLHKTFCFVFSPVGVYRCDEKYYYTLECGFGSSWTGFKLCFGFKL